MSHLPQLRFSALQRAENSSIIRCASVLRHALRFQCSSASRKFLNSELIDRFEHDSPFQCSSASRKFLNRRTPAAGGERLAFQCSSASRKFLNMRYAPLRKSKYVRFSALQRAENSSMREDGGGTGKNESFSALQRAENSSIRNDAALVDDNVDVSVLFSEPKIPQCNFCTFLNPQSQRFQCSSASRKFLNRRCSPRLPRRRGCFSALQRAENSSIPTLAPASIHIPDCDDHASSFLSLPGASP